MEVLVVENDRDLARLTSEAIQKAGITSGYCYNGEEALRILRQEGDPPKLLVLDLVLPKLNGPELIDLMKQSDKLKGVRVLAISGKDFRDLIEQHVDFYVQKPFTFKQIVSIVKVLLGKAS